MTMSDSLSPTTGQFLAAAIVTMRTLICCGG